MNQEILNTIIAWAKKQDPIKVLLLTGSLASKGPKDELSDYDIAIFTDNIKKYAADDAWIHEIAKVWVYEPHKIYKNNKEYPTRLIIYQDALQVDFTLYDLDYLTYLIQKDELPVDYNLGYKVLLDKTGVTKKLKLPTYVYPYTKKPSREEFELAIRIFFFEAFKEAKALVRNDLWHAKIRDWTTKEYLLRMIEWYEKAKHGWNYDTHCAGKRMQSWIEPWVWQKVYEIFAHFDKKDSFDALLETIDLFSRVAIDIAYILRYEYPKDIEKNITKAIKKLKNKGIV